MELKEKHCLPCEGQVMPMTVDQIQKFLEKLPQWQLGKMVMNLEEKTDKADKYGQENNQISIDCIYRKYDFKNYYKTMAFVNALAWISHQENHHPDLFVGYNYCTVQYATHAIQGLSENDFICAAKVDALSTV